MNKTFFIVLIFLSVIDLTAQQGAKKVYNLQECLDIATRQNFDLKLQEAQVSASGADITQAFGAYLPSININSGYNRTLNTEGQSWLDVNGKIIQNNNSYNISANTSLSIFDGFAREANYSRAQNQLNSNQLSLEQTISQVKYNIHRQYIEVVRNTQLIKIRRENFNQGKKELERIQAQYEAGVIPIYFVYSQEAELGNREVEIVQSENQLNIAKTTLLALMGLNPDYNIEFAEASVPSTILKSDIEDFRKQTGSFQAAISKAMQARTDYKASEMSLEAAKSQIIIANSGYMPQLTASGGWRWTYFELGSFGDLGRSFAGLNLSIPVFDNFRTNLNIQNAKLQVSQAEIQKQRIELSIKQAVQNSLLSLDAAEKQLEISDRALKSAEKNFEATSERFRQGSANITDFTVANTQLITSQINRITAVYNYISAQKDVLYTTGNLR